MPRIARHRFRPDDLEAILNSVIDDGMDGQYNDYQGAEQAAMAIQSVVAMLVRRGRLVATPLAPAMKSLMTSVADDERYQRDDFKKALGGMREALVRSTRR